MSCHLTPIGKLKTEFGVLEAELAIANTHFYLGKKLDEAWKGEFCNEFYQSLDFWGFTVKAHFRTALISLCRVFDSQKDDKRGKNLHLLRLIEKIDESHLNCQERRQRAHDLAFLQHDDPDQNKFPDPRVAKLRAWRKKLIAHRDYDIIMGGAEDFLKRFPVDFNELQTLVDEGFSMLERWAAYHHVSREVQRLVPGRDDYKFVLQAMRSQLRQQTKNVRALASA